MSKRNHNFKRRKQDAYDTPEAAVLPLISHLPNKNITIWEPCAGAGDLVDALFKHASQVNGAYCTDIEPRHKACVEADALTVTLPDYVDMIITNPPWTRQLLHPMIERFRNHRPTWLLFDADWMHTVQAAPYLEYCSKIVSVGRVSWMQNGTSGLDNVAWYLFEKELTDTTFRGRTKSK